MSKFAIVCDTGSMHGYLSELISSVTTTYMLPLVPPTQGSVAAPQANTFPSFHSSTSSVTDTVASPSSLLLCATTWWTRRHTHTHTRASTQWLSKWQTHAYLICHSSKHMHTHTHTQTHLCDYLSDKHGNIKPYSSWVPSRRRKNNFPKLPQHMYKEGH